MPTKVLLIGSGGREHAMAKAIKKAGGILYSVMAQKNPGIARLSREYLIGDEKSITFVTNWKPVKFKEVDIAFIGPEAPLVNGLVDALTEKGIPVVGPTRDAAAIEGDKSFMRDLMKRHKIEGAVKYEVFEDKKALKEYIDAHETPFVVKPLGLTGGKGVQVMGDHFQTPEEGYTYASRVIDEKIGGTGAVMIEEKLVGEEFTLQAFTDGRDIKPMPLVQDFKRAYENDLGPNTGGMGSYSCADHLLPFVPKEHYSKAVKILEDIVAALRHENREYKGVIYGQFMETADGPKVVEINCRFGDPEAINVLGIMETDILETGWKIVERKLSGHNVKFAEESTLVKYVVPMGYGTNSVKSDVEIKVDEKKIEREGVEILYASVREEGGKIYTTRSRSLALFARGKDLYSLSDRIEKAMEHVTGEVYHRRDIGTRAKIEEKIQKMEKLRVS